MTNASARERSVNFAERVVQRLVFGGRRTFPGLEPVYQRIFEREIGRLGIADEFFPVGSAANYGLMYVVLRVACEFKPKTILELGAGQTSLLLDRLAREHLDARIVTVEHDPLWSAHIGERVRHQVHRLELKPYQENGLSYAGYDIAGLALDAPIDMLLVDGPPAGDARRKFARHGCLGLLARLNPQGFVVIVDDAERGGEARLCRRIDDALRNAKIAFKRGHIITNKRQEIFASGPFAAAAYM
jgi:predicted O-methyltransferase YrrM